MDIKNIGDKTIVLVNNTDVLWLGDGAVWCGVPLVGAGTLDVNQSIDILFIQCLQELYLRLPAMDLSSAEGIESHLSTNLLFYT